VVGNRRPIKEAAIFTIAEAWRERKGKSEKKSPRRHKGSELLRGPHY